MAKKYGRVTIDEAIQRGWIPAKVWLDGELIEDARDLDDVEGWVDVMQRGPDGYFVIADNDHVVVDRRYGTVRYEPKESV